MALKKRGLEIREQDGDGNCLFRAISLQVYGDPNMHGDVRKQCMDHMVSTCCSAYNSILLLFQTCFHLLNHFFYFFPSFYMQL